jgi:hypothetical protein
MMCSSTSGNVQTSGRSTDLEFHLTLGFISAFPPAPTWTKPLVPSAETGISRFLLILGKSQKLLEWLVPAAQILDYLAQRVAAIQKIKLRQDQVDRLVS